VIDLILFPLIIVLLIFGAAFTWRPQNRTWANVAIAVFGLGVVLFGCMGACSVATYTDWQRNDPYGFRPVAVVIGMASVFATIACSIGIWRNSR